MRYRTKRERLTEGKVLSVSVSSQAGSGRWKRSVWILVALLFSCSGVGYGAHLLMRKVMQQAFYQNKDFCLRHIEVHVNGNLSNAEVLRWAGVSQGQNLLAMDLNQIRARLLKISYIANVSVERKLPDTLQIIVDERQPVALLQPKVNKGFKLIQNIFYIDPQGVVISPKPGDKLKPLPVITGMDSETVVEGVRLDKTEVLAALNFLRLVELSPARLDLDLNQIDVQAKGYLIVHTKAQGLIRFRIDYIDQQLQRLEVIFDFARNEQKMVRTVDLTPERNVPVTFF